MLIQSNRYCPANYVDNDGPSVERHGDRRTEENSSFALQQPQVK